MSSPSINAEVRSFLDDYRQAFERQDSNAIAACYSYPAHIASDNGQVALVPLVSRDDWRSKLGELLRRYRDIGFRFARVLDLSSTELSGGLIQASVHWGLYDVAEQPLYDFDTVYTLGRFDRELRIVQVISPNELPRYLECVRSLTPSSH